MKSRMSFSHRGIAALLGGAALFVWGVAVVLGTGIGYDEPIHSIFPFSGRVAWQLAKGLSLMIMAMCVAKEEIEFADCRVEAEHLRKRLHQIELPALPVEPE